MADRFAHDDFPTLQPPMSERQKVETRFWLQVLNVHHLIYSDLNAKLIGESGLSIAKFDVLAQLHRFPEGLSMGALSQNLKVTNGNVSGLVARLQADGYVKRSVEKNDRRSFRASITPKGEAVFEKAVVKHRFEVSKKLASIKLIDIEQATDKLKLLSDQIKEATV